MHKPTFPLVSIRFNSPLVEDTKKPTVPSILNANYRLNGTTELSWMGDGMETGTTWMIYRNLYADMDEPAFWILVAQVENTVASQYTISVDTVAQSGEDVSAIYAIGGIDVFGNEVDFIDWRLSDSVDEDRTAPKVQLKLYNSHNQHLRPVAGLLAEKMRLSRIFKQAIIRFKSC